MSNAQQAQTWDLSDIEFHSLDKSRIKAAPTNHIVKAIHNFCNSKIISNTNNMASFSASFPGRPFDAPHVEKNQVGVETKVWTGIGRKEELTVERTSSQRRKILTMHCFLISRHGSHCGRHYVCTVHF